MSRRKKPAGLLGPDGRPYGQKAAVRPILGLDSKPLPPSEASKRRVMGIDTARTGTLDGTYLSLMVESIMKPRAYLRFPSASYAGVSFDEAGSMPAKPHMPTTDWRGHINEQVESVLRDKHVDDMESGVQELPAGTPDMTSYADAFAAAAKACQHRDYEDTMYAKREAKCNDCGKYFKRPKGMFGW